MEVMSGKMIRECCCALEEAVTQHTDTPSDAIVMLILTALLLADANRSPEATDAELQEAMTVSLETGAKLVAELKKAAMV